MADYEVRCPNCNGIFFETTKHYTRYQPANGRMFKLKKKYGPAGYNWSTFPQDAAIQFADVCCPDCGGALLDANGLVLSLIEDGKPVKTRNPIKKGKKNVKA